MANTIASSNMSMPVPVVGTDPGPQYATDLNSCLTILDGHNHSSGAGVQITPLGLNINTDLTFGGNSATTLKTTNFSSQSGTLASSTTTSAYVVSGDLYYNNSSGFAVQITSGNGIAGTPGSIANLTSPASATYVSGTSTFVWQSAANTAANMDGGSIKIREVAASANAVTISSPTSLASNYAITLPAALPASQKFVTLDNSGNLAAPYVLDNVTLQISTNTISVVSVPANSIVTASILNNNVTFAKRAVRTSGTTATAGNVAQSASSGTVEGTSSTLIVSCTLTTLGGPVKISLVAFDTSTQALVGARATGNTGALGANLNIKRDSTALGTFGIQNTTTGGHVSNDTFYIPPGGVEFLDVPGAGTYVYSLYMDAQTSGMVYHAQNVSIIAYEL